MKLKKILCGILSVATLFGATLALSSCDVDDIMGKIPGGFFGNPEENVEDPEQTCEHVWGEWTVTVEPTCMSSGERTRVCTLDETHVETGEVDILEHVFETYEPDGVATCLANATESAYCEYGCGTKDTVELTGTKLEHVFVTYVSDNNATCLADGTQSAYCEYGCTTKDSVTEENTKLEHVFETYVSDGNATCYADGTKTALCKYGCKMTDTVADVGSIVGHSFTNYVKDGNATCLDDGTKTAICDYELCDETETLADENSALGHDFYLGDCKRCDATTVLTITSAPTVGNFYYGEKASMGGGIVKNEEGETITNGVWKAELTDIGVCATTETIASEAKVTFTSNDARYAPISTTVQATVIAVAKYGNNYYATLDGAIAVANEKNSGTVYALPLNYSLDIGRAKTAKTIAVVTEIKSGVTLAIPYSREKLDTTIDYVMTAGTTYATCSYGKTTYLDNQVYVASGHTLANAGTINVAGQVSGGVGGSYSPGASFTAGEHGQINLDENATLKNTGSINCYGFIAETTKNNGSKVVLEGGTTKVVFTIGEHRGVSTYFGMIDPENSKVSSALASAAVSGVLGTGKYTPDTLKTAPFNTYYIASVTAKTVVKYGATMKGLADLYADGDNVTEISVVGKSGALISLTKENSYLESKYDPNTNKTDLDIFGDMKLEPMKLTLKATKSYESITTTMEVTLTTGATGDTDGIFLAIPNYFDISLNAVEGGATVDATAQKIKLLPGAKLTVGEGVTLNASEIAVYQNNSLFAKGVDSHYRTATPAELIVNGTLNAYALGGTVKANSDNAILNITKNDYVVSQEMKSLQTGKKATFSVVGKSVTLDYTGVNYFPTQEATLTANGARLLDGQAMSIGEYRAQNGKWYPVSVGVRFETNGGLLDNTVQTFDFGYNLTKDELPTPTRAYYEFLGWYTSENFETGSEFTGVTLNTSLTLYAKWQQLQGKILVTFEASNGASDADVVAIAYFESQEISGDVTQATIPAKASEYNSNIEYARYVTGYYADADCTVAFDFSQEVTESTTIYVKWADKIAVTISVGSYVDSKTVKVDGTQTNLTTFYVMSGASVYVYGKGGNSIRTSITVSDNHGNSKSGSGFLSKATVEYTFTITSDTTISIVGA